MIARKLSYFFIIALLLVVVNPSHAQQQSKEEKLSDQQAETYANLIFEEKISVEETQKLRESLSKDDIDKISNKLEKKLIEKKAKAPKEPKVPILTPEEEKSFLSDKKDASYTTLDARAGCDPGEPVFCWRQFIENTQSVGNIYQAPQHASGFYYTTTTCDAVNDTDLVLAYQYNHYSNPDSLLFYTTSASMTWVLDGALNSYGVNPNHDVRLCITNSVDTIFTPTFIRNNVIIARRVVF